MESGNLAGVIILLLCNLICAAIFAAIGLWARRKQDGPIHFWSGSQVRPEEIADIPAYNRANARLWLVAAGISVLLGALAFLSVGGAGIAMAVVYLAGVPVMVLVYRRIFQRYKAPGVEDSVWRR